MPQIIRAYIGLGGNVGDAETKLAHAVRALGALPDTRLAGVSRLYATRPVGVRDQPDFCNAVVAIDVPSGSDPQVGALALLAALKQLEGALGRRPGARWGPREIDLDLLLLGDHVVGTGRPDGRWLEVPHPRMRERLFVLAPLADLAAELRPPGWSETVVAAAEARRRVEGSDAVKPIGSWEPGAERWTSQRAIRSPRR